MDVLLRTVFIYFHFFKQIEDYVEIMSKIEILQNEAAASDFSKLINWIISVNFRN